MKKVLFVLTSHSELGNTGEKTGFWVEEFAAPYYLLHDKNIDITIASPKGGQPPIDPKSAADDAQTEATKRFNDDTALQEKLANTIVLSKVSQDDFDAIFYPRGHGPLWDLAEDKDSIALIESFYVFKHTKAKDGSFLVKGKNVTGFTNTEEEAVQLTDVVPFLVEDMLKNNGGLYAKGDDWSVFTQEDGLLITGQNPASSEKVAELLLERISA